LTTEELQEAKKLACSIDGKWSNWTAPRHVAHTMSDVAYQSRIGADDIDGDFEPQPHRNGNIYSGQTEEGLAHLGL
jgi:hypothetical protein